MRVNYIMVDVEVGEFVEFNRKFVFKKDIERYVRVSMEGNRKRYKWFNEMLRKIEEEFNEMFFNWVEGKEDVKLGIIVEGVFYNYVKEVFLKINVEFKVFKFLIFYLFLKKFVVEFLKIVEEVIVIEDGVLFFEEEVKIVVYEVGLNVLIYGKRMGYFLFEGEFMFLFVRNVLLKVIGEESEEYVKFEEVVYVENLVLKRLLVMCFGCFYCGLYRVVFDVFRDFKFGCYKVLIYGDIGCYVLFFFLLFEVIWIEYVMGVSISFVNG